MGLGPLIGLGLALVVASDFSPPTDLLVPKPGGKAGETILNPAYAGTTIGRLATALFVAALACIPATFLLIPYYRAREARAFAGAVRLGNARLASTLRARAFYRPYIVYVLSSPASCSRSVSESVSWPWPDSRPVSAWSTGSSSWATSPSRPWARCSTSAWCGPALGGGRDEPDRRQPGGTLDGPGLGRGAGSGLQEGLADALDVGGALQIGL